MLNLIRQHADSWMVKTILWLIILAFVGTIFYSWGMGGASTSRGGVVAMVEGAEIHYSEYDKTFNNLINFYREQFRNQFSEDLIQRLDLKTQALDALIQRKLLLLEAKNLSIKVSDAELIDHIQSFPAFQKDNKYNPVYYNNYLKFNRLSPLEFEEGQREALTIEKLEKLITENTLVSKSEVTETFNAEEESVKLDYIVFSEDHFSNTEPVTGENIKDYYEKNKIRFEVPDQIQVEFVKVEPKNFVKEIEPSEEDIKEYYEAKIADFRVEKKYRASHILFQLEPGKADDNATPEEKQKASEDAARSDAEDALKKIREGADFSTMATKLSDDPGSSMREGSLGEFPRGAMVPEFEAALDKLNVGEISEPVKTPFGYHIIRLDGKQEERIKPLEEVKDTVINAVKESKARQKARRIVKRIHKAAEKDGDFAKAAAEQKVEVKTSDYFSSQKHDIAGVGIVAEFYNAAFTLADNQISDPIDTAEASYLIKLKERKPAYIPELDAIREKVKEKAGQNKNKEYTEKKFKELADRLKGGDSLEKISEDLKMDIQHTPFFSRIDSIPGIGDFPAIKDNVFPLEKGQTTSAEAFRKFYLLRVQDRKQPGEPTKEQIDSITARLKRQKATTLFQDWLKNLREKSDVMIDKTLL